MTPRVLFDLAWPSVSHPHCGPGVYLLWNRERVIHVGESREVRQRLSWQHPKAGVSDGVTFIDLPGSLKVERVAVEAAFQRYFKVGRYSAALDDNP